MAGARRATAQAGRATGISSVIRLAAALLGADVANTLLRDLGGHLGHTMAARLRATLPPRSVATLVSLPQRYVDGELTGTVIDRLSRSITETTSFLNTFTIGVMVLLVQLVTMARRPVFSMSFLVDSSQHAIAGSRDYFTVMDHVAEADALPAAGARKADEMPRPPGIEFDSVSFGYPEGEDVLREITFSIRPGERVAVVGESGGGTTTLISLLLRLYALGPNHSRERRHPPLS